MSPWVQLQWLVHLKQFTVSKTYFNVIGGNINCKEKYQITQTLITHHNLSLILPIINKVISKVSELQQWD